LDPIEVPFRSVSAASIEISSITVSDSHFSASVSALPQRLVRDDRLRLGMHFSSDAPGEFHAELVFNSDAGCQSFPIIGVAFLDSEEQALTFNPYVLDFDRVAVGSMSEQKTLTLLLQPSTNPQRPKVVVEGLSVDPVVFRIASEPAMTTVSSCKRWDVSIQMTAPSSAGLSAGGLHWEVSGGSFSASGQADLIGTAVAH
jgi:hypothetical protein